MFKQFDPFSTDIRLAQESLFVLTKLNELMWNYPIHVLSLWDDGRGDRLLDSNVRAHKISSIINLHKIYDKDSTYSLTYFMRWVHDNKSEFSPEKVITFKKSQGLKEVDAINFGRLST